MAVLWKMASRTKKDDLVRSAMHRLINGVQGLPGVLKTIGGVPVFSLLDHIGSSLRSARLSPALPYRTPAHWET